MTNPAKPQQTYFALLETHRAVDVVRDVASTGRSPDPLTRGIVDKEVGYVLLARARPQDPTEERIIKVVTEKPAYTEQVLPTLPGVARVAKTFAELTA